ncbi:MAG: uracil-DNA glycosylase [Rhizobiales bacterium]|nr:uracil-DNA glycosylase [Rhizobacter sp.]
MFARVPAAWRTVTEPFIRSAEGRALAEFVDRRVRDGAVVYPRHVFRALEFAAPDDVRVAILGQDPYHGPGQAQGLAFSVAPGQKLPPSLRNILRQVSGDLGTASICRDDLSPWAAQGVLLLNATLTVEDGAPQSHANRGWEVLTDALIARVAGQRLPAVFMLWGASAQRKRTLVMRAGPMPHAVLVANHPSPLSANRPPVPFVGCRHFTRANAFLAERRPGEALIRW